MTPIEPELHKGGKLVIFAKDQPEYFPIPASLDEDGVALTEWELTAEELQKLFEGGRIRLWVHTFNKPFQPVSLEVIND